MALFKMLESAFSLFVGVPEATVRKQFRWTSSYTSAAALTGTNAGAETPCGYVKQKGRLVGLKLVPLAGVTANATNYGSIIVRKRAAAAPGTQVAVAVYASDTVTTDDLVAFAARDLYTKTAPIYLNEAASTDLDVLEGDVFTVEVTKTASGVTIPIFRLELEFEGRD